MNIPWKKSDTLTTRAPRVLRSVHVGVQCEECRRVVRCRVGMRDTATESAAVANLRVADLGRRVREHRAPFPDQRRRRHFAVRGRRANLDRAVHLADAGQAGDFSDVDE